MIPNSLSVEIVTPTGINEKHQVGYVRAPGLDGLFGVMPGHVASIIALDIGEVSIKQSGEREFWATSGGYAEIHPDRVVLIVESAERSSNIDVERAKSAAERAKNRLEKKKQEQIDEARARAALNRAMNRLSVAKRS